MKNNWKWMYNPFEYVAGWKAFGLGIAIVAITTVVGYFCNTVFYALEVKIIPKISWELAFSLQALGLVVTVVVMYVAAILFARHTRFQDILGTVTLAQYPLLLMAFFHLAFGKTLLNSTLNIAFRKELSFNDYALLIVFGLISIVILTWKIILLYNAFRVSTNLKGVKCGVVFACALLSSEIATLTILAILPSNLMDV